MYNTPKKYIASSLIRDIIQQTGFHHEKLILHSRHMLQQHVNNIMWYPCCLRLQVFDLGLGFLLKALNIGTRVPATLIIMKVADCKDGAYMTENEND